MRYHGEDDSAASSTPDLSFLQKQKWSQLSDGRHPNDLASVAVQWRVTVSATRGTVTHPLATAAKCVIVFQSVPP